MSAIGKLVLATATAGVAAFVAKRKELLDGVYEDGKIDLRKLSTNVEKAGGDLDAAASKLVQDSISQIDRIFGRTGADETSSDTTFTAEDVAAEPQASTPASTSAPIVEAAAPKKSRARPAAAKAAGEDRKSGRTPRARPAKAAKDVTTDAPKPAAKPRKKRGAAEQPAA